MKKLHITLIASCLACASCMHGSDINKELIEKVKSEINKLDYCNLFPNTTSYYLDTVTYDRVFVDFTSKTGIVTFELTTAPHHPTFQVNIFTRTAKAFYQNKTLEEQITTPEEQMILKKAIQKVLGDLNFTITKKAQKIGQLQETNEAKAIGKLQETNEAKAIGKLQKKIKERVHLNLPIIQRYLKKHPHPEVQTEVSFYNGYKIYVSITDSQGNNAIFGRTILGERANGTNNDEFFHKAYPYYENIIKSLLADPTEIKGNLKKLNTIKRKALAERKWLVPYNNL